MLRPEDRGAPRALASQMLEMLILYGLVEYAWADGDKFDVADQRHRAHMRELLDQAATGCSR